MIKRSVTDEESTFWYAQKERKSFSSNTFYGLKHTSVAFVAGAASRTLLGSSQDCPRHGRDGRCGEERKGKVREEGRVAVYPLQKFLWVTIVTAITKQMN